MKKKLRSNIAAAGNGTSWLLSVENGTKSRSVQKIKEGKKKIQSHCVSERPDCDSKSYLMVKAKINERETVTVMRNEKCFLDGIG